MNPRFAPLFGHVRDWIFDLDNCLYPASTGLFDADRRAHGRLYRAAARLRPGRGQAGPEGAFPRAWHDARRADARASGRPARIPRRRPRHPARPGRPRRAAGARPGPAAGPQAIFTNADEPYARRVLEAIGVGEHFAELHDIHAAELRPKPDPHGYELMLERFGIDPARRGDGRGHGAESQAGEGAGDDHGVGRQWLRARQSRPPTPTSSTSPSPTSANGSRRCLEDE